jgi:hypothetical protein
MKCTKPLYSTPELSYVLGYYRRPIRIIIRDAAGSSSALPRREKKEPEEEWEQIPPELLEET